MTATSAALGRSKILMPRDEPRFQPPDLDESAVAGRPSSACELSEEMRGRLKVVQVIHAALVAGAAFFLLVVFWLEGSTTTAPGSSLEVVAWLVPLAVGVSALIAVRFVRAAALRSARLDPRQAPDRFMQTSIVVGALSEGPVLLAGVMGLIAHSPWPLLVGAALLLVLCLQAPTAARAAAFTAQAF